jgi:hypothetical protein
MEFHDNLSRGSGVVPCGRKDGLTATHMTKLIIAFRNFANAPNTVHGVVPFVHRVSSYKYLANLVTGMVMAENDRYI